MSWDWSTVNRLVDDAAVASGIVFLVVRQFRWRSAEPRRMLRLPLVIIAVGVGYLGVELSTAVRWTPADWLIPVELLLVALTGIVMGRVTRFRVHDDRLQYKLTGAGIWLWVLFVAIRVGSYLLAHTLGSRLAGATGPLLIFFGANRLLSVLVVRARARTYRDDGAAATASAGADPAHGWSQGSCRAWSREVSGSGEERRRR